MSVINVPHARISRDQRKRQVTAAAAGRLPLPLEKRRQVRIAPNRQLYLTAQGPRQRLAPIRQLHSAAQGPRQRPAPNRRLPIAPRRRSPLPPHRWTLLALKWQSPLAVEF
ncbi:unnamed protein product [Pleuronectes platessa]|uniref:Uncharacterized protein n=1 Tax=Pleuronectes platessa TaxID=8262 RepID=A0A9N7ZBS1_PLEPL|nr:unnamed protein product [Pleuronectes platessa]